MIWRPEPVDDLSNTGPGLIVISVSVAHWLFSLPYFGLAFLWARKRREVLPISLAYGCAMLPAYAMSTAVLFFFAEEYGPGIAVAAWSWLPAAIGFLGYVRTLRPSLTRTEPESDAHVR